MSNEYLVLSAMGIDNVGLVEKLTSWLECSGANVEDSKMSVLGGEFAIIMLVSGENGLYQKLDDQKTFKEEELGMTIQLKVTSAPLSIPSGRPYLLETVSLDTAGIVHKVTSLVGRNNLNIEDLETDRDHAPWTGAPLFRMKMHLIIPAGFDLAGFRNQLAAIEQELDLDIKLSPVTSSATEW